MRQNKLNKIEIIFLLSASFIVLLSLVSLAISFTNLTILDSFRIIFGAVYLLFLPGFIISFIFFPKTRKAESKEAEAIDMIERTALSFALSIAIVPLVIFYFNLMGLKISAASSFLSVLGIILLSLLILLIKSQKLN